MRWLVVSAVLLAAILVPFVLFEDWFNELAGHLMRREAPAWSVAGAIVGLLAADVFLPIPSSVVAVASGLLLDFWRGAAAVWAGMMAGCLFGYGFGAGASAAARRFVGGAGMANAERLSTRYGDYAIILCRPVPVLAEASVIVAGIVRRPLGRFLNLTAWSNLGVAMGYSAIGAFSMRLDSFLLAFLGSLAVPGLAILISRLWFARGQLPTRER
jgi:uncharacterized membrane protein YdjX (TVP38/TMEM64 family)